MISIHGPVGTLSGVRRPTGFCILDLVSWHSVMDYHVFVPIPIFLPPHQLLSHRHLLKRQGSISFIVLAIKAVAQQRHSPNQGTLGSRMVVKQSCLFCTSRGHQTRAPQSGNRNHFIFLSKDYEVTIGHTRLASMTGHLVSIPA